MLLSFYFYKEIFKFYKEIITKKIFLKFKFTMSLLHVFLFYTIL